MCTCHGQSVLFHEATKNKLLFRRSRRSRSGVPSPALLFPFVPANEPPLGPNHPSAAARIHSSVVIRNGVPNIIFQAITVFADQTEGLVSSLSVTRCSPFLRGLVTPSVADAGCGGVALVVAR